MICGVMDKVGEVLTRTTVKVRGACDGSLLVSENMDLPTSEGVDEHT